ncbi:NAD binding domain of 6-phosphogluconate dehydrogenase family protein [Mycobacterium xenopi 3993]|nr:NAD binding domain of 6-phosphogluconate dehydrogenase family protein [Mycobacterium xenopi 3993]
MIAVHSTVHPNTCRELAKKAAARGVSVIDAPVSGGGDAAAEGRLLVMVGGDRDVVEQCRPVFETYAAAVVHLGDVGSGQTTKLLNNLLFTANLATAATTLALGQALGVSPMASPRSFPVVAETVSRSAPLGVPGSRPARRPGGRAAAERCPAGGRPGRTSVCPTRRGARRR